MRDGNIWLGHSRLTIICALGVLGFHFYMSGVAYALASLALVLGVSALVFAYLQKGKYLLTCIGMLIALVYIVIRTYDNHQYNKERLEMLKDLEY